MLAVKNNSSWNIWDTGGIFISAYAICGARKLDFPVA